MATPSKMNLLRSVRNKISKSLLTRGVFGTIAFAGMLAVRRVWDGRPQGRQSRTVARAADEAFDHTYGTDTGGVIPLSNLNLTAKNWIFGNLYQAVGAVDLGEILKGLAIPYEEFVFIDLGSGKGRALLLAAALPFKAITGVEFSEDLRRVADDNVRRWPREAIRSGPIACVCMDAADYTFPEGPFVLFMYNPFGPPVMERVVHNVTTAFDKHPRRIVVVYFTPKHGDLWERVHFLRRVRIQPGCHVYDTRSGCDSRATAPG